MGRRPSSVTSRVHSRVRNSATAEQMVEIVSLAVGITGLTFGILCGLKLRKWERQLTGARVAIAFKGKTQMSAPLIDWLGWANLLHKDKDSAGRAIYKMGGTTVAIVKPQPKHGRTKTRTIKEKQGG